MIGESAWCGLWKTVSEYYNITYVTVTTGMLNVTNYSPSSRKKLRLLFALRMSPNGNKRLEQWPVHDCHGNKVWFNMWYPKITYIWFSVSTVSTSVDSTNHQTKLFEKRIFCLY